MVDNNRSKEKLIDELNKLRKRYSELEQKYHYELEQEVKNRTADKCQLELKKSEEKYLYLFNSIDEGFAIVDVILNNENKPQDFRYIELNPAHEKQAGILNKNLLGKTANELKYDFEDFWYETYGKVAFTGEPTRFVHEVKTINKWFDVYVFKINLEIGNYRKSGIQRKN